MPMRYKISSAVPALREHDDPMTEYVLCLQAAFFFFDVRPDDDCSRGDWADSAAT